MDWYNPSEYKEYECTECGEEIDDKLNIDLRFTKADSSGDLCAKCWDIEWEKCKVQARKSSKEEYIGKHRVKC